MPLRQRVATEDIEKVAAEVLGQISQYAGDIRKAQETIEDSAEARDVLIYRLSLINVPNKRIAEASGLTHGRVSQIVKRIGEAMKAQEIAETFEELKEGIGAAPRPDMR